MFNWVCPNCGKDVPPSKTECPYCPGLPPQQPQQAWPQPPPQGPPQAAPHEWHPPQPHPEPVPQAYAPPPQAWQPPYQNAPPPPPPPQAPAQQPAPPQAAPVWHPPQPQYAPPPYAQPQGHWPPQHPKPGPPAWLMVAGFTLAFLGIGAALYFGIQRFGHTNIQEKAGLENPANPSRQKVSNPLQKYVEVAGIRMVSDAKKPAARFLVVNHSTTEITGLAANVTLWASTSRSEEDAIGSFSFKLPSLGPNASKELSVPVKTKLKPYELPDWQNATAEIQITEPQP